MKYLSLLVVAFFVVSCSGAAAGGPSAKSSVTTPTLTPTPTPIRAIYLVQNPGQLDANDLQAHPEVIVTNTFSDFEQHAQTRVALWIDKNATTLIKAYWLDQPPQMYYPTVLVGYNDTLYSFKYVLRICCFSGPVNPDWSTKVLEPGFSVIEREGANRVISGTVFLQGYNQTPRVRDVLNITNALLDGTLKPTPTAIITAPSPTPPWNKP